MLTDPKFFKKENNNQNAAEFKRCLPVNVNTSFTTLAPAIATAEQNHVRPLLGDTLFDSLADYYAANGIEGESTVTNELVSYIQMAVVRLAYWESFDQLAVMMSDRGLQVTNGENRAYRYQEDRLKKSLQRQGFGYLNTAIGYIMEHIDTFGSFTESDYYSERQNSVIRSLKEMEGVTSVGNDFCLFAKLRQFISETEEMELPYRVGNSLADLLRNNRTDARLERLLRSAQGFVAHWTLAEAMPALGIIMSPNGPVVVSDQGNGGNGGESSNPASAEQIGILQKRHREMAERYIGQLVTYCKQHVDIYPEIAEIGLSTDHEKTAGHRNNRGKKTFLA